MRSARTALQKRIPSSFVRSISAEANAVLSQRPLLADGARAPSVRRPEVSLTALAIAAGLGVGDAVAQGNAPRIIAIVVALTAVGAVVLRPEAVLLLWFAVILVDGRWLTFHKLGPLYVTEPLLALLTLGVAVRLLVRANDRSESVPRSKALRFLLLLGFVMFVPALGGLAARTSAFDYATARNILLIVYPLFAVIVVLATDLRNSYKRWFLVAVGGPAIALLLVVTGHAGSEGATSTGAIRVAGYTFALAFGIAPIVLAAAAREGLIRSLYAIAGATPFLIGLVFVNHRSAWLAFIAAAAILFVRRISPPVIVGLAIVVCGFVLLSLATSPNSTLGQEIARAKTVTSTTDPNAQFRLNFWKAALAKSIDSPLIGAGFDPYPANIVPPESTGFDPFPAPHNSFVAIAYRIGFIPALIFLALLVNLIRRGFRASVERAEPRDRAICLALTAIVVYAGFTSAFNVFLEAPYAGPLFWTAVGLLAYAVFAEPFGSGAMKTRHVGGHTG
jgi:O-antigen ligase